MKLSLLWLAASSAVAQTDFADEGLTLLQLRSAMAKHSKYVEDDIDEELGMGMGRMGSMGSMGMGRMGSMGSMGSMGRMGQMGQMGSSSQEADRAVKLADEATNEALDAENKAVEAELKAELPATEVDPVPATEVDPVPGQQDEAAAVGDPHMSLNNGQREDLCCTGSVCKPCPLALMAKHSKYVEDDIDEELGMGMGRMGSMGSMGMGRMGSMGMGMGSMGSMGRMGQMGMGVKSGTDMGAQEEADSAQDEANDAAKVANKALDLAVDAQKKEKEEQAAIPEIDPKPPQQDEASAIGDPHLTLSTGEHEDLCCTGAHCEPCTDVALLQPENEVRDERDDDIDEELGMGMGRMGSMGSMGSMGMGMGSMGMGMGSMGMGMGRRTGVQQTTPQEAIDISNAALTEAQAAQKVAHEAEIVVEESSVGETDVADEAAAVGDPHMTLSTGDRADLCCHSGHCIPC